MKVSLSKYAKAGDSVYDVSDRVICELGKTSVEVRQDPDGYLIVIIKNGLANMVEMEPRAASIWLNVRPE